MIYIQSNNRIPMWDFGSSALHGCLDTGKSYKLIESWDIPKSDATCLVGSVEWCINWLKEYGHEVPKAIDIFIFQQFLKRDVRVCNSKEFLETNATWPIFVKPYTDIKAFTGTQVLSNFDAHLVLRDFEGDLLVQQVIDPIISEWRVYVNNWEVIGCKCYKGDHLVFPNSLYIQEVIGHTINTGMKNRSFTLDFGVWKDQKALRTYEELKTLLIEPNDGWAIGNYGLEPADYLRFCEDRWKQMIGK